MTKSGTPSASTEAVVVDVAIQFDKLGRLGQFRNAFDFASRQEPVKWETFDVHGQTIIVRDLSDGQRDWLSQNVSDYRASIRPLRWQKADNPGFAAATL